MYLVLWLLMQTTNTAPEMFKGNSDVLEPCSVCGRNFSSETVAKHESICMKLQNKSRKVFDMSKKRAEGTEITSYKKPPQKKEIQPKKSNWRQSHSEFINTIRAARHVTQAIKSGKPLPPPLPPTINPDYIQCNFCGRRFNESSAQRHIAFCESQHQRISKGRGDKMATLKQVTSVKYQPPPPRSRQPPTLHETNTRLTSTTSQMRSSEVSRATLPSVTSKTLPRNGIGSSYTVSRPPIGTNFPSSMQNRTTPLEKACNVEDDRVPSGPTTRTGRTAQACNDTKQQSAKQRARNSSAVRNYSSSDNLSPIPQYSSQNHHWMSNSPTSGSIGMGRASTGRGSSMYGSVRNPGLKNPQKMSGSQSTLAKAFSSMGGKFCHSCGAKFPTATSKFCCECGTMK